MSEQYEQGTIIVDRFGEAWRNDGPHHLPACWSHVGSGEPETWLGIAWRGPFRERRTGAPRPDTT